MKRDYQNPKADAWYQYCMKNPAEFPFAFTYDGVQYEGFSNQYFTEFSREVKEENDKITTTICWGLNDTLHVTLLCSHYPLHGATDWKVYFENPGQKDSGILSDVKSILKFEGAYPVVKVILGDRTNWYRPYAMDLTSSPVYFESNSGRPTHINFPYFNLEYGDEGVMLAIGWAGTWRADFRYRKTGCTKYIAKSVNRLNTYLKPGEKIRTALFVRASYQVREENYATNYWRSWYIHSNLPKADKSGADVMPFSTCCLASDTGLPNSDGSISERHTTWRPSLEKMITEDVRLILDGWMQDGILHRMEIARMAFLRDNEWYNTIGTWTLDPNKWPGNTLRESTDFAREHGMKTLMWFEPERLCDVASLAKNFGYKEEWSICGAANNIGNPDCFEWTLGQIKNTLADNRVEMYREDNNCDLSELWDIMDRQEGEDRTGITESKIIDAHYRMWDEIIACTLSYGGCGFVDSCAGGGGRNDLESLRRGIPLLRSDFDRTSTALRLSMTTSFNKWIPFCGAINKEKGGQHDATGCIDQYVWRASYLPIMNVDSQFVQDPGQDFGALRAGLNEWKRINKYLTKEFYVHTHWHTEEENTDFTAYSFFDSGTQEGILLAFRQEQCVARELSLTLPYVETGTSCIITNEDNGEVIRISGDDMQEHGFTLVFDEPRMAKLFRIKIVE